MDGLLLLSRNDIPFISAELNIHQPTIKEIALIGDEVFFTGLQFLTIDKNSISGLSPQEAQQISNFDIFAHLVTDAAPASRLNKVCAESLLTLLFPDYIIKLTPAFIALSKEKEEKPHLIDKNNFNEFQSILKEMFCLDLLHGGKPQTEYNAANKHAQMIIDKIYKGRQKLAEINSQQNNGQKIAIFSRYISILAVGERKDMNLLLEYSVYQLFDEFTRFNLREQSDLYLEAKMAGAQDLQEVENWMKDIHSKT